MFGCIGMRMVGVNWWLDHGGAVSVKEGRKGEEKREGYFQIIPLSLLDFSFFVNISLLVEREIMEKDTLFKWSVFSSLLAILQ